MDFLQYFRRLNWCCIVWGDIIRTNIQFVMKFHQGKSLHYSHLIKKGDYLI